MSFWSFVGAGVFAALGIFLAALLVCRKSCGIADQAADVTYFSGHPGMSGARSGTLRVEGESLVFASPHSAEPYFRVPIGRVKGADARRHVAGLLGYAQVGPGASLGSNHFLLVDWLDDDVERRLRFASRIGAAGTIALRDRILEATRSAA